MTASHELDLKLLDKALERHASGRQVFSRDLKIAATIVTGFLFGIFFRFIDLSDQQLKLGNQLKEVGEAQATVAAIKDGLGKISDTLQKQGAEVTDAIKQAPPKLRARIVAFNSALAKLKQTDSLESEVSNVEPTGAVQSSPHTDDRPASSESQPLEDGAAHAFAGLTPKDLQLLKEGRGEEVEEVVRRIVNDHIVPPVFNELNRTKIEKLNSPVIETIESLDKPLGVSNSILNSIGWNPAQTRETINVVGKTLQEFEIQPPPNDDWWKTIETKERGFEANGAEAQNAFSHLRDALNSPTKTLGDLEKNLSERAMEASRNKAELDSQAKALNANYEEVQSLIAGVAKPFASLAMEPSTVVRYAPAIFAGVMVFFLTRFASLRRQQISLAQACHDLGYSDGAVAVYFENSVQPVVVAPISTLSGRTFSSQSLTAILFAIPGLLVFVSAWRVWHSPSLSQHAPLTIYAITLTAMTVAYCLIAAPAFFAPSFGQGTPPNTTPQNLH